MVGTQTLSPFYLDKAIEKVWAEKGTFIHWLVRQEAHRSFQRSETGQCGSGGNSDRCTYPLVTLLGSHTTWKGPHQRTVPGNTHHRAFAVKKVADDF